MIRRSSLRLACLLALPIFLGGCSRALFADYKANTTQFDAYDRMRGNIKPMTVPDVFGTPQPALRERLAPGG